MCSCSACSPTGCTAWAAPATTTSSTTGSTRPSCGAASGSASPARSARREERAAWIAMTANWPCGRGDLCGRCTTTTSTSRRSRTGRRALRASYPLRLRRPRALLRARARPVRPSLWLDGLVGGLTLSALAPRCCSSRPAVRHGATPRWRRHARLSRPRPAAALLVGVAFGLTGWRPGGPGRCSRSMLGLTASRRGLQLAGGPGAYADVVRQRLWPAQGPRHGPWPPGGPATAARARRGVPPVPAGFAAVALGLLRYAGSPTAGAAGRARRRRAARRAAAPA